MSNVKKDSKGRVVSVPRGNRKRVMSKSGEIAVRNMTKQLNAQLKVLTKIVEGKKRELKYAKGFVGKLPNAALIYQRCKKGVEQAETDLGRLKLRIRRLQKEKKINRIL